MPGLAGGQTASTSSLCVSGELATEGVVPTNGAARAHRTTVAPTRRVIPEILTNPDPSIVCRNRTDRLDPPGARQDNPRHTGGAPGRNIGHAGAIRLT